MCSVGFVRKNLLFLLYSFSLVWLFVSCIYFSKASGANLEFTKPLLLFFVLFVGLYFIQLAFLQKMEGWLPLESPPSNNTINIFLLLLFAFFVCVVVMHLFTLGELPIIEAYRSTNDYEIARIRQQGYYDLAVWQRYASDYSIKGIGPILLVLSAKYNKKIFYTTLIVGLVYVSALFVKANPVYLLLPLVFYFFLSKKYLKSVIFSLVMVASVGLNWTSSSPAVRQDTTAMLDIIGKGFHKPSVPSAAGVSIDLPGAMIWASIRERLVIVPAQVTAQWYAYYEDPSRREQGCAYRLYAKFNDCEYQHIPTKLYAIYYEDLVKERGLTGSLNSGSYIHDFANFGYLGVAVGAVLFVILFGLLRICCAGSPELLALNLMPVLSLLEMPVSTVLNSGGWLLIIAVSIFLKYWGSVVLFRWKRNG